MHLNDLGCNNDNYIYEEILEIFQIKTQIESKNDHKGGLFTAFRMYIDKMRGVKYIRKKVDNINYIKVIKHALSQGNPYSYLDKGHSFLQGHHM